MSTQLLAAIISAAGAIVVAVLGYVLTKRAEREARWRDEKLAHYKAFVSSLSGVLEGETSDEGQKQFARACNDIQLFAPEKVIGVLAQFQDEIRVSNPAKSLEHHDALLSQLFFEIRRDLRISPRDSADFRFRLWASGVKNPASKTERSA
jgi:hypothetical protein